MIKVSKQETTSKPLLQPKPQIEISSLPLSKLKTTLIPKIRNLVDELADLKTYYSNYLTQNNQSLENYS